LGEKQGRLQPKARGPPFGCKARLGKKKKGSCGGGGGGLGKTKLGGEPGKLLAGKKKTQREREPSKSGEKGRWEKGKKGLKKGKIKDDFSIEDGQSKEKDTKGG